MKSDSHTCWIHETRPGYFASGLGFEPVEFTPAAIG